MDAQELLTFSGATYSEKSEFLPVKGWWLPLKEFTALPSDQ